MANNTIVSQSNKNILGQLIATSLNPIQQTVLKEVERGTKSQVQEAMAQGVPSENILKTAGIPTTEQEAEQFNQQFQQTQQVQQPVQTQLQQPKQVTNQDIGKQLGLLGNLLTIGGRLSGPGTRRQALENIALEQQITGKVPLQQKDIDATILKGQIDAAKDDEKRGLLTANNILSRYEPVANNFQGIIDSFARVEASTEDPSPAGDLALIFNFMKILDPNSVVREGEFANAQNSTGVPQRVRNFYNQIIRGTRLNIKQRNDFSMRAKKLFKSKERQFKVAEKQFRNLAIRNQIDPERVLRKVEFIGSKKQEPEIIQTGFENFSDEDLNARIEELKRRQ